VCFFAAGLPGIRWQPTEPEASHLDAIATRIRESGLTNIEAPIALDVHEPRWPVAAIYDAIICINMVHIAPWSATNALCIGAARHLGTGGKLVLYGPYLEQGAAVQSNLDFDSTLKRRNQQWGLRELEDVTRTAALHGLPRQQIVRMPANNLAVVFAKSL
jgi:hypothetical protein